MKFMRAADARQRAQNDEDVERLRKDMAVEDGDEEMDDDAIDDQGLGRAIFGPKGRDERLDGEANTKAKKPEMEEGNLTDADDEEEPDTVIVTDRATSEPKSRQKKMDRPTGPVGNAFQEDRQKDTTAAARPSSTLAKPFQEDRLKDATDSQQSVNGNWLTAVVPKRDRKRKAFNESRTLVNLALHSETANTGDLSKNPGRTNQHKQTEIPQTDLQPGNTNGWTLVSYKGQDNDESGEEAEPSDPILTADQKQAEHKSRAFAVDDAIASTFATEKAEAAESEDEKEISNHLPGWGSWAGHGLTKSDKRANAYKKHNPLHKTKLTGVKKEDRKDARLENVIISEKQNRKGKHYMAPILPHGFETKAQYERSLRLPMGPEWSTKEVFQRATRPRVVVKPGTVVEAMEMPLV
jgi:U3 small nucleolar RNA-associated protein 14